jgi:aryl-alcohol dehydrogenase-like predicted oxidoreductase
MIPRNGLPPRYCERTSGAVNKRLALETVQFGLPYGIANESGQVSRDEVDAIVAHAWDMGLNMLDTAIAYGESEQCLGAIGVERWQITSKLPPVPDAIPDVAAWVREAVAGSLRRLRVAKLYGVLLHRSLQLLGPRGDVLYGALVDLKQEHKVDKIGVSIYGPTSSTPCGHTTGSI